MEVQWKAIKLENKDLIENYYGLEQSRNCEATFANNLLWSPYYNVEFTIIKDMLIFKEVKEKGFCLTFPIGKGDLSAAMDFITAYFEQEKTPFCLYLVTKEQFHRLEEIFPHKYQIELQRDKADYIYETEKLITLSGKKLHSKRNHINKFKQENALWNYEAITEDNRRECYEMARKWRILNGADEDDEKSEELCVTVNALNLLQELDLKGGALRVNGEIVAFTIGEEGTKDTFIVHIEKAFADIQGAYPMINQQFVEHVASSYQYINREEDTGSEGLRKAKMSYRPIFLEEKGVVTLK